MSDGVDGRASDGRYGWESAGQLPLNSGLAVGADIEFPGFSTFTAPYWASWPKSAVVIPWMVLPKFHTQAPAGKLTGDPSGCLLVIVKNG